MIWLRAWANVKKARTCSSTAMLASLIASWHWRRCRCWRMRSLKRFGGPLLQWTSDAVVLTALCAGLGSAAIVDSAHRKIPNGISLGVTASGVVLAASGASGVFVGSSLLGFCLGFLLMLPGHVLGATGAGDVKLFAAAGAVLGVGADRSCFSADGHRRRRAGRVYRVAPRTAVAHVSLDRSAVRPASGGQGRHRIAR